MEINGIFINDNELHSHEEVWDKETIKLLEEVTEPYDEQEKSV